MVEVLKGLFRRRPAEWVAEDLQFLHEQDGDNERTLKEAMRPVLASYGVRRAYLVAVQDGSSKSVALCLAASESGELVTAIGRVVKEHLPKEVFMDILFIRDSKQESRIARLCRPFHVGESE